MTRTRSELSTHAPPRRLGAAIALLFATATLLIAACGGGGGASGAPDATNAGETMGLETPGPTVGY